MNGRIITDELALSFKVCDDADVVERIIAFYREFEGAPVIHTSAKACPSFHAKQQADKERIARPDNCPA